MIYQDRRALKTLRQGIVWLSTLGAASPLIHAIDSNLYAAVMAGAVASLLAVYVMMWGLTR